MRAPVVIVGAGVGGLTLALFLHRAGIACRIYESTAEILPLGVGINVLPHATAELRTLGVLVAALIRDTETVLAYPMVDQDPLPRWSFGRLTLLGDAAHPMVPRGSNGAGQAILDARCLADQLVVRGLTLEALTEYDRVRNAATAKVVQMNRSNPLDAILREVHERSGDKPFARIEDVVSREELARIADNYKQVAGLRR